MIYLMRHGEIKSERRFIGQTDIPLTKKGEDQIAAWRPYFSKIEIKGVYCSRLQRSLRSASIITENTGCAVHPCNELNEINLGKWDGRKMAEIRRLFPQEWEARGKQMDTFQPEGGESFLDLSRRVMPFFEKLAQQYQKTDILMMGHAGVNRVILCQVLGVPVKNLFRMDQDYACLTIIEAGENGRRVKNMNMCRY